MLIWVSLERSFLLQKLSVDDANFLIKGDDIRSGTKAKAHHEWL